MLPLTNPMAYTFGRFLPERYKPAFYDSAVSFVHPVTSLFPHANAGEISSGPGSPPESCRWPRRSTPPSRSSTSSVGIVVILIRGIATQWMTNLLIKRGGHAEVFAKYDEYYAAGHIQGVSA